MAKSKTIHEEYDDEHRYLSEAVAEAFTHIGYGFNVGLEGKHLYSITIQLVDDGSFRFIARARDSSPGANPIGLVAYGSTEEFETCLSSIEVCLRFDNLGWRKDKYYKDDSQKVSKEATLRRVTVIEPKRKSTK